MTPSVGESSAGRIEPRANPLLIGQDAAAARLDAFRRSGRLPHALILGGPHGVGKATLAFRFARKLLAEDAASAPGLFEEAIATTDRSDAVPDSVFRSVASGGHPDLRTVE